MASRPHQRYSIARPNNAARSNGMPSPSTPNAQKAINLPSLPVTKTSSQRLKVVIRRLPPGLTQDEFETTLGEAWRAGCSQVDWMQFRPGKVSRDPSKPSKPGRAYLNLTREEHLTSLANHIRDASFVDEKGSMNDAALLGLPTVDFAPYPRIPGGRIRHDARQGTIDQDPEFIEFLESLTNPVAKIAAETSSSSPEAAKAEITVTPLIQFLRDKKANKGKDKDTASPAKVAKQGKNEAKESKGSQASEKKQATKSEAPAQPEKRSAAALRVEKAAREAVKVLNKQVEKQTAASPKTPAPPPKPPVTAPAPSSGVTTTAAAAASKPPPIQPQPSQAANERRRERGSASAAARMLQRDLGIGAPTGRRRGEARQASLTDSPKSASVTNDTSPVATKPPVAPAALVNLPKPSAPSGNTGIPTGPSSQTPQHPNNPNQSRTSKSTATQPARSQPQTSQKPFQTPPAPTAPQTPQRSTPQPSLSPSSTQSFLKHANPSQGITEPLLSAAFSPFGTVIKVEIDKKKGFAYVDFEDNESLKKAIAASPVKVAEGQVVVLERKSGGALQQRNVRGGGSASVGRGSPAPATTGRGAPAPVSAQSLPVRAGPPPNGGRGGAVPGGPAMRGRGATGGRGIGRGGGGQAAGAANGAGKQTPGNATIAAAPSTSSASAGANDTDHTSAT